jgi:hypothetical protein
MRLAALSNMKLQPWTNWTTLGPPLLRPLAAHPGGQLIEPPTINWRLASEWSRTVRAFRQCDTTFWMQGSSRPEIPIWALSAMRPTIRRSAFVVDAWRPALTKIGYLAVAQRLSPCFIAFREAYDELSHRFPRGNFVWMPFGVDTEVFCNSHAERDIFAYWMGRRSTELHEALIRYCADRQLVYRYTSKPGEFANSYELGALVARCKYFVVTPPDIDNPSRTGGFSPLVMRYFEGLAAGARLLGVRPRSGEFEDLIPRKALCEVRADGSDLAEALDRDMIDDQAWDAVEQAGNLIRAKHSWSNRARQIFQILSAS